MHIDVYIFQVLTRFCTMWMLSCKSKLSLRPLLGLPAFKSALLCLMSPLACICPLCPAGSLCWGVGGGGVCGRSCNSGLRGLSSSPGFKPRPLAVNMQAPSHWTPREVLEPLLKLYFWYYFLIVFFLIPDIIFWHFPCVKNAQSFWSSSPMTKRCFVVGVLFQGGRWWAVSSILYIQKYELCNPGQIGLLKK